jgi:hypothetical protein
MLRMIFGYGGFGSDTGKITRGKGWLGWEIVQSGALKRLSGRISSSTGDCSTLCHIGSQLKALEAETEGEGFNTRAISFQ